MKYKYNGQWYDLSIKALDGMPIGAIIAYPSANIPNGWLECNGSSITSANYPELYNLIGGTLPNYKGRVLVGQDTSQTEFDTLGETGGSKELQAHYHTFGISQNVATGSSYGIDSTSSVIMNTNYSGTGNSGNLQPYVVCKWIIKAKQTSPLMASVLNSNSNSTTDTYSCDYINDLFPTDNLPVGTEVEFNGQSADIPNGWTTVSDPCKTITFNNEWLYAGNPRGMGLHIIIPIHNPEKKSITVNLSNKEVFTGSAWTSLGNTSVDAIFPTFVSIGFITTGLGLDEGDSWLIRLAGTISVND